MSAPEVETDRLDLRAKEYGRKAKRRRAARHLRAAIAATEAAATLFRDSDSSDTDSDGFPGVGADINEAREALEYALGGIDEAVDQ